MDSVPNARMIDLPARLAVHLINVKKNMHPSRVYVDGYSWLMYNLA